MNMKTLTGFSTAALLALTLSAPAFADGDRHERGERYERGEHHERGERHERHDKAERHSAGSRYEKYEAAGSKKYSGGRDKSSRRGYSKYETR